MNEKNNPHEPQEVKGEGWKAEHEQLVKTGRFDAIPKKPIKPGDMVAVRGNDLIHQVYEVQKDGVVVGYDLPSGQQIRETLPLDDIRDGAGYQNAFLQLKGLDRAYKITVEGDVSKLWDKTREN